MKTPTLPIASDDALFDVECRIARRADELSRLSGNERSHALANWLEAEREIWQQVEVQSIAVG